MSENTHTGTVPITGVVSAAATTDSQSRRVLVLLSACVVLMVGMVAAINLAIPLIGASDLRPSSSQMLWIVDAYVIAFGGLLIPAGVFGDHHGHKRSLINGLLIFVAGSVLSAMAPSTGLLIAGRAVSGVGAALALPATLSVIVTVFAPAHRPRAIATWAAMTGMGGVLGNLGGGLVLQFFAWRALFLLSAPIALVLVGFALAIVPSAPPRAVRQDPIGAGLLVAGFFGLLFGIIEGPELGWPSKPVVAAFVAAALLLAAFVCYELRSAHPLLDPRLLRVRQLRAGALGVGATFFGMFALFYVNAQYLQYVKGFSALGAGVAILPLAVGIIVVSRCSVILTARFDSRRVVAAGMVTIAVGLVLLSLAERRTPYLLYAVYLLVMAAGAGLAAPPLSTEIMSALPRAQAGLGAGINSSTRELGSALGVAVIGTVFNTEFTATLPSAVHATSASQSLADAASLGDTGRILVLDSFVRAMDTGYRIVALVMVAVTCIVLVWNRRVRLKEGK